jgi:tRNA pseudouridine13 synthase
LTPAVPGQALSAQQAALEPPRAHGAVPAHGILRAEPEDFVVEEELGFAPAGSGAHLLLKVKKRNANTHWVARELARLSACRPNEVGFAGLKDRRAVALQWFSVPRPRACVNWAQVRGEGFEVLEAHPHTRKLPRGALAGNHFAVRIHSAPDEGTTLAARLAPRLAEIARCGVPNYFGPQRFGRDGANLDHHGSVAGLPRIERGFVLSAARSLVFNAVLAERVRAGSWRQLVPGDLANLDGRGSFFAVQQADADLDRRCEAQHIHPSGPLWGEGDPPTRGAVLALESRIGEQLALHSALCSAAGMRQERRSLRLTVRELSCEREAQAVVLRFRLARGGFATVVLRELIGTAGEVAEA